MPNLKCPHCGANVLYNPGDKNVECPSCSSKFSPWEIKESIVNNEGSFYKDGEVYSQYTCSSCGASLISQKDTAAFSCPYCGGMVVTEGMSGDFEPYRIIPFKISRDEFKEKYMKNARRFLVPSSFKKIKDFDGIVGVYLPYYIYDSEAKGYFKIECSSDEGYSTGRYYGTHVYVKHMPVGATPKLNQRLLQDIEPYDYSGFVQYSASYLAGFVTEKKSLSNEETDSAAKYRIGFSLLDEARHSCKSSRRSVKIEKEAYEFLSLTRKYVLFPAWMTHVKYKGKDYQFLCNGQTGKMAGNLPVSKPKCILLFLLIFLGIDAPFFLFFLLSHQWYFIFRPTIFAFILASIIPSVCASRLKLAMRHDADSYAEFKPMKEMGNTEISKKIAELGGKKE